MASFGSIILTMDVSIKLPITRKKLSDFVEEELERMIRQGEIAEGESLPSERELMAMFEVGRPSVREALAALAHKGIVKITRGERARVTRPSADTIVRTLSGLSADYLAKPEGIKYFEQLREFFELSLVRYAAANATDEQINALKVALDANENTIDDSERFALTDVYFHGLIAGIPGNPIFVAVHQAILDWLITARPRQPSRNLRQTFHKQHTAIYDSIRLKDEQACDGILLTHLRHMSTIKSGH